MTDSVRLLCQTLHVHTIVHAASTHHWYGAAYCKCVAIGQTAGHQRSSPSSCSVFACLPFQQSPWVCALNSLWYFPGHQHLDDLCGWVDNVQEFAQTGMYLHLATNVLTKYCLA